MVKIIHGFINYPHLTQKWKAFDKETYSAMILIKKEEATDDINDLISDGAEIDEKYKDFYIMNASSIYEIPLYDRKLKQIDATVICSGDECNFKVSIKEWNYRNKTGKKAYLQAIQKLSSGIEISTVDFISYEDEELPFS